MVNKTDIIEHVYSMMVYSIVAEETKGMDSVYEDYIVHLVGIHGLNAMVEATLVETCGVINGRPLYVLYDKN